MDIACSNILSSIPPQTRETKEITQILKVCCRYNYIFINWWNFKIFLCFLESILRSIAFNSRHTMKTKCKHMFDLKDVFQLNVLFLFYILIHGCGISFYLFVCFSIFFIKILSFSLYRFFTSLVQFIPKYFIIFIAIVNWIGIFKLCFQEVEKEKLA